MQLTDKDRANLAGETGPAVAMAMRILVGLGEVLDAPDLMDISAAHIDGCILEGEANLEFAERLAGLGGQVVVPTTLNATSLDLHNWQSWGTDPAWAAKAQRLAGAYTRMGAVPTWTCAPYQTSHKPVFGQQIAWAESNAVVFANSVIGARTNRYGDFTDICAALTGRVPRTGLHLDQNRRGQVVFRLADLPSALRADDAFYPILGYLVGQRSADFIPVLTGLPPETTEDQLKALGAAMASSGSVALFHAVGRTPEAPTLEAALGGLPPLATYTLTPADLLAARRELGTTSDETRLDAVVLGSPHFSLAECERLALLLDGRRVHGGVSFVVTTNRLVKTVLAGRGVLAGLERAGVRLAEDTCILLSPMLGPQIETLMTNSAKYAYYVPGKLGRQVVFGSLAECVESAVAGRVVRQ